MVDAPHRIVISDHLLTTGRAAECDWEAYKLVTAPVLPLTVTQVAATEARDAPVEYVRGHIITTDDVNTVVLQHDGRVRYLDNDLIRSQDLCPGGEEIPRYRLRFVFPGVSPVSLEQPVLSGLGRAHRVFVPESTACRVRL